MRPEPSSHARRPAPDGTLARARRRDRRGMALLAALLLLALSAAFATATFSAARAMRRAALAARMRSRVESGVPRAFAELLVGWNGALDTLGVGGVMELALHSDSADGPPLERTVRVERTTDRLYAVTVDIQALGGVRPLARRRARLWLERLVAPPPPVGAGAVPPPPFVTPWALSDLY